MTDIKSIQRLLVVQTVYEQTLNKNREDIKVEELFSDIINQSSYKDKLKKSNLNFAKELYIGLRNNHVEIDKILYSIPLTAGHRKIFNQFLKLEYPSLYEKHMLAVINGGYDGTDCIP